MTRGRSNRNTRTEAANLKPDFGPVSRGWVPAGLIAGDEGQRRVEWVDLSGVRLSEPFFSQTVERVRREKPETPVVVTDAEALLAAEGASAGLEPSGFIFHTSRCGSTLVANALKALDDSTVVAEAPVLDSILGLFFGGGGGAAREMFRLALLRAAVGALGQQLCGDERRYFVKFTNWGVIHRQQIARLWPGVPWLFLYRYPVEVIVSNMEKDAGWMRIEENADEAALLSGVSVEAAASMSREEHCARVVGRCCEAAAAALDESGLLVNYDELSPERLVELIGFFGVEPTKEERERVRRVSGLYSKDTGAERAFSADSHSKRAVATDAVRAAAERWAAGPYNMLERLRRG